MNTALLTLDFIAGLSLPFGFVTMLLGLSASLIAVGLALRGAPEGYEAEDGFHFKEASPRGARSTGVALLRLRPHNAG